MMDIANIAIALPVAVPIKRTATANAQNIPSLREMAVMCLPFRFPMVKDRLSFHSGPRHALNSSRAGEQKTASELLGGGVSVVVA